MGGFLGTEASFFPDFVVVAMFIVLPAFVYGIRLVKKGKKRLHGWVMGVVFGILFVTVVAFVIWARFYNDHHVSWEQTDLYRKYFMPFVFGHIVLALSGLASGCFCVGSALFNIKVLDNGEIALRNERLRKLHKIAGWFSMILFILIAISGFMIYYARYIYVYTR